MHSIKDIDLNGLKLRGKKLILIDVDNTIVHWRQNDFQDDVIAWLGQAKSMGFQIAIISNTRKVERLKRLSEKLDIVTMTGKFKPSRTMFLQALERFQVEPKDAVMIGDQLFTDVLGANRSGIEAIWVKQLSPRDFIGTKLSRLGERFLRSWLYRALVEAETPVDTVEADTLPASPRSLFLKQFTKFAVVGAVSFIIDAGLTFLLVRKWTWDGELVSTRLGTWLQAEFPKIFGGFHTASNAAVPVLTGLAALVAMYNSFVMNRRWTFEIKSNEHIRKQLAKFYVIAIIGFFLNDAITSGLNNVIAAHPNWSLFIAKATAAIVVAFWSFFGQRLYAFRADSQ